MPAMPCLFPGPAFMVRPVSTAVLRGSRIAAYCKPAPFPLQMTFAVHETPTMEDIAEAEEDGLHKIQQVCAGGRQHWETGGEGLAPHIL